MTISEYYKILDLPFNASVDDIKKAYRKKARLFHPDINQSEGARDNFILATEAYDFLLSYHDRFISGDKAYDQAVEEWHKYRKDRSRRQAQAYARASYIRFKQSKLYKSTRILDGTTIIFSFIVAVMVLSYTIFGYIFRLKNPGPEFDKPSIFSFLLLLALSIILLTVSSLYLKAFLRSSKKHREKSKRNKNK